MARHASNRSRTVRSAILRLGPHCPPGRVVEELARHGIVVGEDQVERARIDLLKELAGIRNRPAQPTMPGGHRVLPPKVPGRR
jgi:hypothetical protein